MTAFTCKCLQSKCKKKCLGIKPRYYFSAKVFLVSFDNEYKKMKFPVVRTEQDSLMILIKKLLTRKKKPLEKFNPLGVLFINKTPDTEAINQFKAMFNCAQIPVSYMFIVAFRYIAQLLVSSEIPSRLLGMIHLSSDFSIVNQHNWAQPCDIEVCIVSFTKTEKGITYLINTKFFQGGQLTLINENRFFERDVLYSGNLRKSGQGVAQVDIMAKKRFTPKMARRYAKVSKDYNPIHLNPWLAKLLGMKSAIMHGMYGLHWLLTQEGLVDFSVNQSINVQFNRPCYLPSNVLLTKYRDNDCYGLFSENLTDRFMKVSLT